MNPKEVKKWLIKEAEKKNTLAETYLSLLENATPQMQEFWFNQLGTMLNAVQIMRPEIVKAVKQES